MPLRQMTSRVVDVKASKRDWYGQRLAAPLRLWAETYLTELGCSVPAIEHHVPDAIRNLTSPPMSRATA